jgi:hypothetical protein
MRGGKHGTSVLPEHRFLSPLSFSELSQTLEVVIGKKKKKLRL